MKLKIILLVLLVATVVVAFMFDVQQYLSLDYIKQQQAALEEFYQNKPFLVMTLYFVIYIIMAALALPVAIVSMLAGALFGFWKGLVIVSFASTIGATLLFLLTRYIFRDFVQQKIGDRMNAINQGLERDGVFYIFGLRLVVLFPFAVVNAALALTNVKATTFYWASQLGMLAGTAVFINAGTQLAQIESASDILSPSIIASFALLGIFPIIAKYALRNFQNRNKQQQGEL